MKDRSGEIFHPDEQPRKRQEPQILGAAGASGKPPTVLDGKTQSEPLQVLRKPSEGVTVRSHTRSKPRRHDA